MSRIPRALLWALLAAASPLPFLATRGPTGSLRLTPVRQTAVPASARDYVAMAVAGDTVTLLQAGFTGAVRIVEGRISEAPLRCAEPAKGEATWASLYGSMALMAAGPVVWACSLLDGGSRRVVRLPDRVARLSGYDGRTAAVSWMEYPTGGKAALIDVTSGRLRVQVALDSVGSEVRVPVPGIGVASPFVPLGVAGDRLVIADPRDFELLFVDPSGDLRTVARNGLDPLHYTQQEIDTILERVDPTDRVRDLFIAELRKSKPFFDGATMTGQEDEVWIATQVGWPDSAEIVVLTEEGITAVTKVPGAAARIAVGARRVALLVEARDGDPARVIEFQRQGDR